MSLNRCDRCNRELVDADAQYGWRCEKIMGTSPKQRTIKGDLPALYQASIYAANDFLNRYKIDPKAVDMEKFYEATAEVMLLTSMPLAPFDSEMRRQAFMKACDAFGFAVDTLDPWRSASGRVSQFYSIFLHEWYDTVIPAYLPKTPELYNDEDISNGANETFRSLGLTLSDDFWSGRKGSKDLSVTIKGNNIIIDYHPSIYIQEERGLKHLPASDSVYRSLEQRMVEGFKRWEGFYDIQGTPVSVTVSVNPKRAKTAGESNVLATLKEGGRSWVPDSIRWNTNRTAQIKFFFDAGAIAHTENNITGLFDPSYDYISVTAAHEFGHVLGLMDAYGEWYQPQAPLHRVAETNEDRRKMREEAERSIMWGDWINRVTPKLPCFSTRGRKTGCRDTPPGRWAWIRRRSTRGFPSTNS